MLSFEKWFAKADRSRRIWLMVPPRIKNIPCGCRFRELEPHDVGFKILRTAQGWIHDKCGRVVLTLTGEVVEEIKKLDALSLEKRVRQLEEEMKSLQDWVRVLANSKQDTPRAGDFVL